MLLIAVLFTLLAALMIFLEVLFIGGIFGALAILACAGLGVMVFLLHLPFTAAGQIALLLLVVGVVARYVAKARRRKFARRD